MEPCVVVVPDAVVDPGARPEPRADGLVREVLVALALPPAPVKPMGRVMTKKTAGMVAMMKERFDSSIVLRTLRRVA